MLFSKLWSFIKYVFTDISAISLLGVNVVVIYFTLVEGWNLLTLLWIYWGQSVVIGVFAAIRLLMGEDAGLSKIEINGKPVTFTNKKVIALVSFAFFVVWYGGFHAGYLIFLLVFARIGDGLFFFDHEPANMGQVLSGIGLFAINHTFSFLYNRLYRGEKDTSGHAFQLAFKRIVPMHITVVTMFILGGLAKPFFLIVKTLFDLAYHRMKHTQNVEAVMSLSEQTSEVIGGAIIIAYKTNPTRVLLISNARTGNVTPPGGAIDGYESVESAAARELWEESGLVISKDDLIDTELDYRFKYSDGKMGRVGYEGVYRVFLVAADELSDPIETADGKNPAWCDFKDLDTKVTFPELTKVIAEALKKVS